MTWKFYQHGRNGRKWSYVIQDTADIYCKKLIWNGTRTPAFQAVSGFFETNRGVLAFFFQNWKDSLIQNPTPGQGNLGENPTPSQAMRMCESPGVVRGVSGLELTDTWITGLPVNCNSYWLMFRSMPCPALVKSLPPGYKIWSNAPGLPGGGYAWKWLYIRGNVRLIRIWGTRQKSGNSGLGIHLTRNSECTENSELSSWPTNSHWLLVTPSTGYTEASSYNSLKDLSESS